MEKLTDNEIIKSFTETFEQYKEKEDCRTTVYKEILDLINRKDAEIENLRNRVKAQANLIEKKNLAYERICVQHTNELRTSKTEGYKEFAEKLLEGEWYVLSRKEVEDTLKELTDHKNHSVSLIDGHIEE